MTRRKDMVNLHGLMGKYIREIGRMGNNMDLVY